MIKSLLEIHSPSRVTAEIGQFFAIGFADGINEGISNVNTAVIQLMALSNTISIQQSVVNTQWVQKLQEMETSYKSKMDKINAIQTSTLIAMAILNKFKVNEIKTDTVKATTDMVTEVGTSLVPLTAIVEQGFTGATSFIQELIPKGKIWAADFMDGYISTIREKISELEAACEEVADTVSDYLHFTRPDKGPLRNYEEWMPHMMQGLARGIRDNRGLMLDQIKGLSADMAGTIQGGNQQAKQPVNLTSYNVFTIEGRQIAEVVNEQLGILL